MTTANGTSINTFGNMAFHLDFGLRRDFLCQFLLADVTTPILGIDFLSYYNLLVDAKKNRLIDDNITYS